MRLPQITLAMLEEIANYVLIVDWNRDYEFKFSWPGWGDTVIYVNRFSKKTPRLLAHNGKWLQAYQLPPHQLNYYRSALLREDARR